MGWTVYNSDGQILQGSSTLADDSVTSAKIVNGAILNADINASAAIAKTKLASLDVVNADVNSSAAIAYTKLAALADGNILVGNGSNVATSVNPSGDVNVVNDGTFSISTGVIVNADVNTSAAIALSKLATTTASRILVTDGSGVITPSSVTTANLTDLTDTNATTLHSHAGGGGAVTRAGGNLDGTGTYQNAGNTEATTTSTSAVDMLATTSLTIGTTTGFDAVVALRKTSGATAGFGGGIKINGTITCEADATGGHVFLPTNNSTNAAENRWGHLDSGIRLANYAHGINSFGSGYTNAAQSAGGRPQASADMPVAQVTSIIIRALSASSSVTGGLDEMHVYTRAIS